MNNFGYLLAIISSIIGIGEAVGLFLLVKDQAKLKTQVLFQRGMISCLCKRLGNRKQ